MTDAVVWAPPRSAMSRNFNGLLDRLVQQHQLADLDAAGLASFLSAAGDGVLLLVEDPDKVPESWDLAVIFPDLIAASGTRPRLALLRPEQVGALPARFGVKRMPALLFLRDHAYVGVIEGLREWGELVAACRALLQAPASRPPGIDIALSVKEA